MSASRPASRSASSLPRGVRAAGLLLLLIGTLLALDRLGSVALTRLVLRSNNRIALAYAGRTGADVLILGNSVADAMTTTSLLREQTGLRTYTMAVHGLDARSQLVMVKALLRRNPAPRLAVLEVRSASDREVIASQWAMFGRESPELVALAEEASPSLVPWRRIFTLYNFNSRNLPSVLTRVFLKSDQSESDANGRINEAKKRSFIRRHATIAVDRRALAAFVATIELLQSRGTRVLVVAAPMHPVTRRLGNWATVYAQTVHAALPPGTRFLNALRLIQADEDFEDAIHMNASGRRKFAPALGRALIET